MKRSVLFALLMVLALGLGAETPAGSVQFSIRFSNKEIYTNDPDQPILLQVGLRNQGTQPVWFSMPSQPVFQLSLKVMAAGRTGLYLPPAESWNANRFNNQPVFFRDVSILPGEEFNYTVNLKDWVALGDPGVYTIAAQFYPSLLPEFQGARGQSVLTQVSANARTLATAEVVDDTILNSNVLTLSLRPTLPVGSAKVLQENLDAQNQTYLKREARSPDEIINYLLEARQAQEEAKFFLYLNTEDLYKRAPQFRRTFLAAGEEERRQILADFQNELWKREDALSKVPSAFDILSTSYTAKDATVTAKLKFDIGDYFELREYKYALKRSNGIWEVYDYQVRNLGSERKGRS
ncbi:MAG: hypothetical protein WCG80_17245 [Spirochaetales bacterium]